MLPFKYLGIPIVGRELQLADCNSLVDQVRNYLSHWKNKLLSMGGRVQLVNWVMMDKLPLLVSKSPNPYSYIEVGKANCVSIYLGENLRNALE